MSGVAMSHVVLFGAGGAGMAVAHALLELGVGASTSSTRFRRRRGPGRQRCAAPFAQPRRRDRRLAAAVAAADGHRQCDARSGMANIPGMPFAATLLRPDLWVADIVYFPAETALMRAARAAGCRTLSGTGMAIFQAVQAFELITGTAPDAERNGAPFRQQLSGASTTTSARVDINELFRPLFARPNRGRTEPAGTSKGGDT